MVHLLALYVLSFAHEPCLEDAWRFGLPVMPGYVDNAPSPAKLRWHEAAAWRNTVISDVRMLDYESSYRAERTWNYLDDLMDTRLHPSRRLHAARELRDNWLGPVAYYCGTVP